MAPKSFNPSTLGRERSSCNRKLAPWSFTSIWQLSLMSPNKTSSSKSSFNLSSSTPVKSMESRCMDVLEKSSFVCPWFSRTSSVIKGVDCKYSYKFLCHLVNANLDKQGKTFNSNASSKGVHSSLILCLEIRHSFPVNETFSLLLSAFLNKSLFSFGISCHFSCL